jgi:hypothetical protein
MSIFELEMGKAYRVVENYDGWLVIEAAPASNVAGQITIKYTTPQGETPAGTYTLVGKKVGSSWRAEQTFTGDNSQHYIVTIPDTDPLESSPVSNPSLAASINLQDSVFTNPLTFTGTLSAVGANQSSYTKITFTGALRTPNVNANGTFEANFPAALPSGADPEQSTYEFPTSMSMRNANISVTGSGTTITMVGSISATTAVITIDSEKQVVPKHVELTGSYNNSHSTLNFNGSIIADWTNPVSDANAATAKGTVRMQGELTRTGHPTYSADLEFSLNSGAAACTIDLRVGSSTLSGTGSATVTNDGMTNPTLTLTNQSGVQFAFNQVSGQLAGTIKVNAQAAANISSDGSLVTVRYTDDTIDQFPI